MKNIRLFFAAVIVLSTSGNAWSAQPPAIDASLLQKYFAPGKAQITIHVPKGSAAVCAPDIPYTRWYAQQFAGDFTSYDPRLKPYTRDATRNGAGELTCRSLTQSRFLVWVFGSSVASLSSVAGGQCGPVTRVVTPESTAAAQNGQDTTAWSNCVSRNGPAHWTLIGQREIDLKSESAVLSF